MNYQDFLIGEEKIAKARKNPDKLMQRFLSLKAIPEISRDRGHQVEFEALQKALKARWRLHQADERAKKLIGKFESDNRRVDAHTKILLGVASVHLAAFDKKLRDDLFSLVSEMASADREHLKFLLDFER